MLSKFDNKYLYNIGHSTKLMASMDTKVPESGARPNKSKKKSFTKSAGPSTTEISDFCPSSVHSPETLLAIEKLKNNNLQIELEIKKAQLEMAKLNRSSPGLPQTPPKVYEQSPSLQAAMTLTPADSTTLLCEILMLKQLRDKKTAESTLPKNYVFSSKGTIRYNSLELPEL